MDTATLSTIPNLTNHLPAPIRTGLLNPSSQGYTSMKRKNRYYQYPPSYRHSGRSSRYNQSARLSESSSQVQPRTRRVRVIARLHKRVATKLTKRANQTHSSHGHATHVKDTRPTSRATPDQHATAKHSLSAYTPLPLVTRFACNQFRSR